MCMDFQTKEDLLADAKEAAGDMIRNAAWKRAKTELQIMIDTFENTGADKFAEELEEIFDKLVDKIENKKCFDQ